VIFTLKGRFLILTYYCGWIGSGNGAQTESGIRRSWVSCAESRRPREAIFRDDADREALPAAPAEASAKMARRAMSTTA